MENIKHIIVIYLDWDRPKVRVTPKWVMDRIKLFHDTTLKSLLNQTFQDFDIWMMCSDRYADLTKAAEWHPRINRVYGRASLFFQSANYDFIALTRMDSDDLYHVDALAEVADNVKPVDKVSCLIFRKNLAWNVEGRYIGRHIRQSPPFFTQIWPKSLYRNWDYFNRTFYVSHGKATNRHPCKELSENKVCVVKHDGNVTKFNKTKEQLAQDEATLRRLYGDNFVTNKIDEMVGILKPFSVTEDMV